MNEKDDPLIRFSVAIGGELLQRFDRYREEHQYPNRSEAVRGLMRAALIEEALQDEDAETVGVVTLIYDHHSSRISDRLTELQHEHLDRVVTSTHMHLDSARCLEVILLRGPTRLVRELANGLIGTKGIENGRLVLAAAHPVADGSHGKHVHGHDHEHEHHHSESHPHH